MIVVDLGCADRGEWFSLEALAEHYEPDLMYGFDPSSRLKPGRRTIWTENSTRVPVRLARKAAWIHNGTVTFDDDFIPGGRVTSIGYAPPGMCGRIGTIGEGILIVRCFDFSAWLRKHGPAIVKMDIEGAEYALLHKLIADGTDRLITELLIEWHDQPDPTILEQLACPVTGWWM